MEITLQKSNQLKSIAILMMLCLHLFNQDYHGLFQPLVFVGGQPVSYYISLFCDACVPIFAFVSGYGLYVSYQNNQRAYLNKNMQRTKKLYIQYWIILLLFVVLLGWLLQIEGYPGNWQKFMLSFTGLEPSYNGAWWYFTIYVAFIFTSSFWFRLLDFINPYFYLIVLLGVYVVAFYLRIYQTTIFENSILHWAHTQGALYFCTLLQFMLGAFAVKYKWQEKVSNVFNNTKQANILSIFGMILLIVFHALIPNFIVAPFTAIAFIFLFLQINLSKAFNSALDYFTPHATNMWLIHMFFYLIYFQEMIYAPQYPILIFIWLVVCCIIASYFVNMVYNKIEKLLL